MTRTLADSSGWRGKRREDRFVFRVGAVAEGYLDSVRRQKWVLGLGLVSVCLAGLIAHGGGLRFAVAFALLPLAFVVLAPRENRLPIGATLVLVLPWWYTLGSSQLKVFVVASVLAMSGLMAAEAIQRGSRPPIGIVDLALAGFVAAAALSVVFVGPYTYHSVAAVIDALLPLAFYVAGRNVRNSNWRPICWVLLLAGTVASLPLFYEFFALHRPLFGNPDTYQWKGEAGSLFRPGGTFGSPPAAVTALAMTTLSGLSLLVTSRSAQRLVVWLCLAVSIGGMIVTFTRAGLIGFALGVLVFVAFWRPISLGRLWFWTAAVSLIFVIAALPHLTDKGWYQEGVTRKGNLAAREVKWRTSWPVITNSTTHLVVGHGFNSLLVGHPTGLTGQPASDLAAVPILIQDSPHSQYIRTLLEQGLIGLGLLLAWLVGSLGKAVGAIRRGTASSEARAILAGCAAAIVSFLVASSAGDGLRYPSCLAILALLTGLVASQARPESVNATAAHSGDARLRSTLDHDANRRD
jgi:O-antigen ligase